MGQVSLCLRRTLEGYAHWCPACREMHRLPDTWQFNGDVNNPTFTPSFKHKGMKTINDANGKWTGEWERTSTGNPIPFICHYILTNGILNYCADCTHSLANKNVPLPELPDYYKDSK